MAESLKICVKSLCRVCAESLGIHSQMREQSRRKTITNGVRDHHPNVLLAVSVAESVQTLHRVCGKVSGRVCGRVSQSLWQWQSLWKLAEHVLKKKIQKLLLKKRDGCY